MFSCKHIPRSWRTEWIFKSIESIGWRRWPRFLGASELRRGSRYRRLSRRGKKYFRILAVQNTALPCAGGRVAMLPSMSCHEGLGGAGHRRNDEGTFGRVVHERDWGVATSGGSTEMLWSMASCHGSQWFGDKRWTKTVCGRFMSSFYESVSLVGRFNACDLPA